MKIINQKIILKIVPTDNDIKNYGKSLTKPDKYDLCTFKKNSRIAKDFAQKCVSEKIVINLWQPLLRDYFKTISYSAYNAQQFKYDNKLYVKVANEHLKEDDTPEGFEEIKLSEFYRIKEMVEEKGKE